MSPLCHLNVTIAVTPLGADALTWVMAMDLVVSPVDPPLLEDGHHDLLYTSTGRPVAIALKGHLGIPPHHIPVVATQR